MNRFYAAWRDAAAACAEELSRAPRGGSRRLWGDYTLREAEGRVTVVCRLRLLHRGRTAAQRTFTQVWENGRLVPPGGKKRKKSRPADGKI